MSINISGYSAKNVTIGVLGSHSALEISYGARQEGLRNLVVSQKGREKTYATTYAARSVNGRDFGCVDEVLVLDTFKDILLPQIQQQMLDRHVIFVPHRSFEVYVCQDNYDVLFNQFPTPMFGNRAILAAEERNADRNQYFLLEKAGIPYPQQFTQADQIDRLVIVKVPESERKFERGFFFAHTPDDFRHKVEGMLDTGKLTEKELDEAVIEEFILGPTVNLNFFYSPLDKRLELLGTDTRRQTNLDGILRLPASQQMEIARNGMKPKFEEAGHIACTVLESMVEQIYELGERFVAAAAEEYAPGIIGPFALQCAIKSGPPKKELIVYDVSLRVPGSPGIKATPYSEYLWGEPVSIGRRIAMEVKEAMRRDQLGMVVT
ncbi:MAG: DUF1297 domain-containing protein [bacterium]